MTITLIFPKLSFMECPELELSYNHLRKIRCGSWHGPEELETHRQPTGGT